MQFKFFSGAQRADFKNVPFAKRGLSKIGCRNFLSRRHGEIFAACERQLFTGPIGGDGNNIGGYFQPKFIPRKRAVHHPKNGVGGFGRDGLAGLAAQNGNPLPVRLGGGRK